MANALDYIHWRGDLTFDKSEFNDIDALIFSWLTYFYFEEFYSEGISILELNEVFTKKKGLKAVEKDIFFKRTAAKLLGEMAKAPRFKDVIVSNCVSEIDFDEDKQFCALTFEITPDYSVVAFRGTDEFLVGWEEDFNMAHLGIIPAQSDALCYLENEIKNSSSRFYVAGHSKGGNLAMFAYSFADEGIRSRVESVYNFDGPGFSRKVEEKLMLSKEEKEAVNSVIRLFVPQSAFVGMFFNAEREYKVAKSRNLGALQHYLLSWEVLGKEFVCCRELDTRGKFMKNTLNSWIATLSDEQIKEFSSTLFSIFENADVKTFDDLNVENLAKIVKLLGNIDKNSREMIGQVLKNLFVEGVRSTTKMLE